MAKLDVGGQAVIEGVMMKSPHFYAISVRTPEKKLITKTWRYKSISEKIKIFKLPFLRGIIGMWEMLRLGMKALTFSADVSSGEDETEKLSDFAIFTTLAFSFLLAIGLFVLLPYIVTHLMGFSEDTGPVMFNLIDGIIKIIFFIIYVYAISFMPDIKRVFQNHGAEHMTVNAYEKGKALTVKNVKDFGTYHPRCGTSFIVFVLVIMIAVFSFIPSLVYALFPNVEAMSFLPKKIVLFFVRILFIPIIAGISYELLKMTSRFKDNAFIRIISYPGKLIQQLTTKKPEALQIEAAIASLKAVAAKEKKFIS